MSVVLVVEVTEQEPEARVDHADVDTELGQALVEQAGEHPTIFDPLITMRVSGKMWPRPSEHSASGDNGASLFRRRGLWFVRRGGAKHEAYQGRENNDECSMHDPAFLSLDSHSSMLDLDWSNRVRAN